MGLGLHNLSGSRKIVDIVHKVGHSISYNLTCDIETGLAEGVLKASKEGNVLPIKPISAGDTVFTHYWVDTFDVKIDRINGGGSVNTTHLVAYQQPRSEHSNININSAVRKVRKQKGRKLFIEDIAIHTKAVNKVAEPAKIQQPVINIHEVHVQHQMKFILWLYSRKYNSPNKNIPTFKGWTAKLKSRSTIIKTIETYRSCYQHSHYTSWDIG